MPEPGSGPSASSSNRTENKSPPSSPLSKGDTKTTNGGETADSAKASPESRHGNGHGNGNVWKLSLGALGVVFGDIGTSPLYSVRECFHGGHLAATPPTVLGLISLIFWSLTLIVSIKYVAYVLRADNKGEGGILALMALASSSMRQSRLHTVLIILGVFGAALLYGDGVITPAISVLSAVEGLQIAAPSLHTWVLPIAIAILVGLFAIQRHGTAGIGTFFGPVMILWFTSLAALGVMNLLEHPTVLFAVNPLHGLRFLTSHGATGFTVLGAVFLAVTGGESLYADLGHFGRVPIRRAWYFLVFPALVLNYMGQGALILEHPELVQVKGFNPFFLMVPPWALYPMVALSTAAAVVASQALISGVYSLSQQATMLGLLPRTTIKHTSESERGQIYLPTINWMLMLGTIWLVLEFRDSARLANAYGIAVSLTMLITTMVAFFLVRRAWGFSAWKAYGLTALFLIPELAFAAANFPKIPHGGWFPLLVGAGLFVLMTTWKRGREVLYQRFRENMLPLEDFFDLIQVEIPARVPGTAVFMTGSREGTPPALLHNFLHNRVVHQHVVLLTIVTEEFARVAEEDRFTREELPEGFMRMIAHYGFMEQPDVPRLLARAGIVRASLEGITVFLGRETMIATKRPGMAHWRVHLFSFLSKNAQPATRFFNIPPDRVMELGAQIEL